MSASPTPLPFAGIGLAVDAVEKPAGPLVHEAKELARLAGEDEAAALIHLVARLVACDLPGFELMDLFSRWANRVEGLRKTLEGTEITIRHRLSRGRHGELKFGPGADSIPRQR